MNNVASTLPKAQKEETSVLRVQNEGEQRLTELCQRNIFVIANAVLQQHKRQLYTWTSLDAQF